MIRLEKNYSLLLLLICCVGIFATCSRKDHASHHTSKQEQPEIFAIKNVTIHSMTPGSQAIEHATIVISGNKILSINEPVPPDAAIIDGSGKWLIPGLIDMHVHIPVDGHFNTTYPTHAASVFTKTQDIMTLFVANGVTTVFDLNARAGHFGQRNEILRGDVVGPRMALAAMIDGGDGDGRVVNTAENGRQAVRSAKAEGYEFIKVYSKLNAATYKAIVEEATTLGIKVVGHIPNTFRGKIADAFVPGFGMVAHAEEFFKQTEGGEQDSEKLAKLAKANGTWVCPTLVIIESAVAQGRSLDAVKNLAALKYVHPLLQSKWLTANNYNKNATAESISRLEKMTLFNSKLVTALREVGVPIVAGTDAGSSGVVWGFSLHDELELLVKSGLTPREAIDAATRLPATWIGTGDKTGTVETGKLADLVLLDADPITDIRNTRKIAGVCVNGRWMGEKELELMLSDLAKRNAANRLKWDWQKRNDY